MFEQTCVMPLEAYVHNWHTLTSPHIPLDTTSHIAKNKSRGNEVHSIHSEVIARGRYKEW